MATKGDVALWSALLLLIAAHLAIELNTSLTRSRSFSVDSMNYVDAARNLLRGAGLSQTTLGLHGQWPVRPGALAPFTAQAPAYPVAIAAVARLGATTADAALFVPWLFYGLLFPTIVLLARAYSNDVVAVACIPALLLCRSIAHIAGTAWSDMAASVFLLWALCAVRSARDGALTRWAIAAGLLGGLAFAWRYSMWPVLVLGLFIALDNSRARPVRTRVVAACAFYLAWGLVAAIVIGHNLLADHTVLGPPHARSTIGFAQNLREVIVSMGARYLGTKPRAPVQAVLLAVPIVVCAIVLYRRHAVTETLRHVFGAGGRMTLTLWAALYVAILLVERSRIHFDRLEPRLLLPATVVLVVLFAGFVVSALRPSRRVVLIASAVTATWALLASVQTRRHTAYATDALRVKQSALLTWLSAHTGPDDLIVGEDVVDVAFYLHRPRLIAFSPYPYSEYTTPDVLKAWIETYGAGRGQVYLVLRGNQGTRPDVEKTIGPFFAGVMRERGAPGLGVHPVALLEDGSVYRAAP